MKKIIFAMTVLAILILFGTIQINADSTGTILSPVRVFIDGRELSFAGQYPVIVNGRTLVPVCSIFEAFGIEADELDVPPQIVNDRTLVPLRAISEALDAVVEWDDETRAVLITSCGPDTEASYEVGRVWLVSGGAEYEPGENFVHGAMYSDGHRVSISGIRVNMWLADNLNNLPIIQYNPDIQIFVEGEYGQIVTWAQVYPEYYNEMRLIGLLAENFIDGAVGISLPYEAGTFLVYVDVVWSGADRDIALIEEFIEFTAIRYVFKIMK